jgi:pimeloyl-ACP methyl ester carboxylesterase
MPFAQSGNARIWYDTAGDGEPVVLVHGGLLEAMDAHRFWIAPGIYQALAHAGFRALVYDRRYGGGKSPAPIDRHSWDTEADDLVTVLSAAGPEQVHIVAGSNGVSVAVRFAKRFPERVRSLALCWPTAPDNALLHAKFRQARSLIATHGPDAYVTSIRTCRTASGPPPLLAHLLGQEDDVVEVFRVMSGEQATSILDSMEADLLAGGVLRGVSRSDLARLGVPTLVIPTDPEDPFHTRAVAERLVRLTPDAILAAGTPVSPAPTFPPHLPAITRRVVAHLHAPDNCR